MIRTRLRDDGHTVRLFDRRTNQLIVTETRRSEPFRAVPRAVKDLIVGNPKTGIIGLDQSKQFVVRYQDFMGASVSAVRCWKCATPICQMQPVLRKVEASNDPTRGELVKVTVNGQTLLLGSMLPYNHYREGLFAYRTKDHRLARFSYLHCADCTIADEHGEALLACLLGQCDHRREQLKPYLEIMNDDAWAQYMYHWSGIELVGLDGPSLGPNDLMKGAT